MTTQSERTVVRNEEEQYSIWPLGRELPPGWVEVGVTGSEELCLEYIDRTWIDLRPLSLRRAVAAAEQT